MPFNTLITLTQLGSEAGPFDLFSDVDNYVVPFETNIPSSAFVTGFLSENTPNGTQYVKLKSYGDCVNSIIVQIQGLPSPSVTPSNTPSVTPTISQTPSSTPSESPTNTPTVTNTPSVTPTFGLTPSPTITSTITSTPSITPSQTSTPASTPPGGQLFIYARYINTSQEFGYSLNGGSYIGIGEPTSMSCLYVATISGLQVGDELDFVTLASCSINGDTADCPNSTTGCVYSHTFVGTTYVYITVDASNCC